MNLLNSLLNGVKTATLFCLVAGVLMSGIQSFQLVSVQCYEGPPLKP